MLADALWFVCGGATGAVGMGFTIIGFLRRPRKATRLPSDLSLFHTEPDDPGTFIKAATGK